MRRDPKDFEGCEMELIYIAARVGEAKQVEFILESQGIDYAVQVEEYRAGVIFASVRAGAFFYVLPELAEQSRQALSAQGYKVQEAL